jgi:hypothetical protein
VSASTTSPPSLTRTGSPPSEAFHRGRLLRRPGTERPRTRLSSAQSDPQTEGHDGPAPQIRRPSRTRRPLPPQRRQSPNALPLGDCRLPLPLQREQLAYGQAAQASA